MNKYYLNGIDWITQALNCQCRKTPCRNNGFIIAFELEGSISGQEVKIFLQGANAVSRLLTGKTSRQKLHLAPYWKCSGRNLDIDMECLEASPDNNTLAQLVEDFANRPFRDKYAHLATRLVLRGENTLLLFKFDHLLFDGGGGELFLDELHVALGTANEPLFKEPDCLSPQLSRWSDKFESGRSVNRILRDLNKQGTRNFFTFHPKHSGVLAENRFHVLHVPAKQANAFFAAGEEKLGAFMNTPLLLALVFGAVAELAGRRGAREDDFIFLPATFDLRSPRDRKNHVFFNQWSIAPFCLSVAAALQPDSVKQELKDQFVEVIKSNFLSNLDKANLLMRIIPLPLFARIASGIFAGTSGSCSFAFLPESGFKSKTFAGRKIKNLLHLPQIPPKPGLGIFINRYNEALNIVVSFRDGIISRDELEILLAILRKGLQEN